MKNFVKLIQQVYEEKFSVVMNNFVEKNFPVTFLSMEPVAQAVETVKNFRAQGLNITNLVVVDSTPPPVNFDYEIVHVSQAAKIYPKPEYVFTFEPLGFKFAKKFLGDAKIFTQAYIRGMSCDKVLEIFMRHLPELQAVYESLIDEESKKTFCGYWLGCITNQQSLVNYANTPQYICHGFLPKTDGIVIDCGAFDGATSLRFANMGCKVYGFEMDKKNYERAANLAAEKNFVVENLALGSRKREMNYNPTGGAASRLDKNGTETAFVTTIDSYVGEKNLPRVDFIKMDVEGAELDILKGATITIAKFKPILALSAYHKLDDFWTLTNFIKSIRPDYEFAMRQYATTTEDITDWFPKNIVDMLNYFEMAVDMPNYEECVLFAR